MKKKINIFLDVEYNKQELPERGLFLSVILQALLDATNSKSIVNKDKPKLTFYPRDEPTQLELSMIEAELDGESVAREEYDWHREQKAKDKQIQDRMITDELEYERGVK